MTQPEAGYSLEPLSIDGSSGTLFALLYTPIVVVSEKPAVLFFPPFAEELNKVRRMVALMAQRLVQQGFAVLVPDLFGTGDSSGDFAQASWETWIEDMDRAHTLLDQRGFPGVIHWGVRSGCLLAMQCAQNAKIKPLGHLFWQPVVKGNTFVTQFLRLKMAADLAGSGERVTTKDLRDQLLNSQAVEIAGYTLGPDLFNGLDAAELVHLSYPGQAPVDWWEIVPNAERGILPVSQKVIDTWAGQEIAVNAETVIGEAFWNTPEIALVPELIQRSSQCLQEISW